MTDDAPIHQGELGAVARAEAAEGRADNAEGRAVNADAELARREEELESIRERSGSLEAALAESRAGRLTLQEVRLIG